jgi:hypothetical protein
MSIRNAFIASIALVFGIACVGEASAQSSLPPCPFIGFWDRCIGTYTYTYTGPNGGGTYVGEFRDNLRNGQGTYTWPDGRKYVGEWRDGNRNGQGTYTWPDGRKYVGQFRDDQPNGQGTITRPDGRKYVGQFRDDQPNGQGTYYGPTAPGSLRVENGNRVKMVESGGIYHVPVVINDALKLDFIVDSGASDVSIPSDVVLTLIRTGTIKKSDFIGTEKYGLADGSTVESGTFIIRSLKVGDER